MWARSARAQTTACHEVGVLGKDEGMAIKLLGVRDPEKCCDHQVDARGTDNYVTAKWAWARTPARTLRFLITSHIARNVT